MCIGDIDRGYAPTSKPIAIPPWFQSSFDRTSCIFWLDLLRGNYWRGGRLPGPPVGGAEPPQPGVPGLHESPGAGAPVPSGPPPGMLILALVWVAMVFTKSVTARTSCRKTVPLSSKLRAMGSFLLTRIDSPALTV